MDEESIQRIIVFVVVLLSFVGVGEASTNITVVVNGERLAPASALTKVIDQSVYVPIRSIAEHLGATVTWNSEDKTVNVISNDHRIQLALNDTLVIVNGEATQLEKALFAEAGRTYVPVRFLSESLGLYVDWVQETRSVVIASQVAILTAPVADTVIECSEEDKKWLAKIIEAEASGESLEGKIAVG